MKALFLMFHGFDKANGISKKIHYQVKALKECGLDVRTCYYQTTPNGERRWIIDDEVIADFGTGFTAKIWKRVYYSPITEYVRREKIEFIYMRSFHNASPFTLQLVRKLKRMGAKVVMEIPTYPYDQEYVAWSMKFNLAIDRCFRHRLAKELDGIVTFSNAEHIFGGKTIRISNGIDFEAIPIKRTMNDTSRELHLIGVAEVHYWHGFDRLIHGLAEYYRTNPEYKVYFHIVGPLSGIREQEEILPAIRDNHLEPYVILHGPLHSDKLEEQFQLVEVSEWIDYNTKEKLGFYYTVLFPKLKFEKIKVGVKNANQLVSNEELEQRGQVTVSFEGLLTWASLYNGRLSVKAEAANIRKAGTK